MTCENEAYDAGWGDGYEMGQESGIRTAVECLKRDYPDEYASLNKQPAWQAQLKEWWIDL